MDNFHQLCCISVVIESDHRGQLSPCYNSVVTESDHHGQLSPAALYQCCYWIRSSQTTFTSRFVSVLLLNQIIADNFHQLCCISAVIESDHRGQLWAEPRPGAGADGGVGNSGRPPPHVQRPAQHQEGVAGPAAEQEPHRHQPGPAGYRRHTSHCQSSFLFLSSLVEELATSKLVMSKTVKWKHFPSFCICFLIWLLVLAINGTGSTH